MPANNVGLAEGRGGGPCVFSEHCVVDAVPLGCGVLRDGRWVLVNRAWARLLGEAAPETLLDRPLCSWVEAPHRADLDAVIESAPLERDGKARVAEVTVRRGDGETAILELTVTRLVERSGGSSVLVAGRDVTERKRVQEQLVTADRMASISFLAAGVAHEINNPLAAVLSNLELAQGDFDTLASASACQAAVDLRAEIEDAVRAAGRVQQVVHDLRGLARHGGESLESVDAVAVLESVLRIAGKDLSRRAQVARDLRAVPPVAASFTRLAQVFLNLLVNALQAIPEGAPERNQVRLATWEGPDGEVTVEVADSGCGMTEAVRSRLFTPFFTTRPPGEGTGLGLALSARYVAEFGGRISVESEVGRGSTFQVHLRTWAGGAA